MPSAPHPHPPQQGHPGKHKRGGSTSGPALAARPQQRGCSQRCAPADNQTHSARPLVRPPPAPHERTTAGRGQAVPPLLGGPAQEHCLRPLYNVPPTIGQRQRPNCSQPARRWRRSNALSAQRAQAARAARVELPACMAATRSLADPACAPHTSPCSCGCGRGSPAPGAAAAPAATATRAWAAAVQHHNGWYTVPSSSCTHLSATHAGACDGQASAAHSAGRRPRGPARCAGAADTSPVATHQPALSSSRQLPWAGKGSRSAPRSAQRRVHRRKDPAGASARFIASPPCVPAAAAAPPALSAHHRRTTARRPHRDTTAASP